MATKRPFSFEEDMGLLFQALFTLGIWALLIMGLILAIRHL